ncbi:hypothetical protein PAXRUDRAFT_152516, partial [Paxillus rubicundulus Ve08.2h10]
VEHAFAALKGWFQSLCELHLQMQTEGDLHIHIVGYWVESCLILHDMVVWFEEQHCDEMDWTTQWAISEGKH